MPIDLKVLFILHCLILLLIFFGFNFVFYFMLQSAVDEATEKISKIIEKNKDVICGNAQENKKASD